MTSLQVGNKHYKLASDWQEISAKKFLQIAGIRTYSPAPTTNQEILSMQIAFFMIISNVPQFVLDRIQRDHNEHLAEILEKVNWCFRIPTFRDNPLPKIVRSDGFRLKRVELIGPIGLMNTSSFAEFMAADEAFIRFHNSYEWSAAWLLFSVLWRPQRTDHREFKKDPNQYNGDLREPFNIELCQQRAEVYEKKIPQHYATAALLYFECLRVNNIVNHPHLKILFQGGGKSSTTAIWITPLLQISNTKFGPFKDTADTNFLLVLHEMANQMHDAKKREEEARKKQLEAQQKRTKR